MPGRSVRLNEADLLPSLGLDTCDDRWGCKHKYAAAVSAISTPAWGYPTLGWGVEIILKTHKCGSVLVLASIVGSL